jgi:anti-anti-sigma factor
MTELEIRSADRDGVVVLTAAGVLDIGSAGVLRTALDAAAADGRPYVVLDLQGVRLVDSTGLALLVRADRSAREGGGWVRLAGPCSQLRRMLHVTNLERRLDVYETVVAAVNGSRQ